MAYGSFEELEVWQRSCALAVRLYDVLDKCRDYSLKDQMTRAAVSIASNIAEGAERGSAADFIRFLHFAKGSAAELRRINAFQNLTSSQDTAFQVSAPLTATLSKNSEHLTLTSGKLVFASVTLCSTDRPGSVIARR